tara:strand:+ start:737 stop:874 length:138 start_codon:yes stop_codon:yes gene_type:complete
VNITFTKACQHLSALAAYAGSKVHADLLLPLSQVFTLLGLAVHIQ